MSTRLRSRRYRVTWESVRHHQRETILRAYDALDARGIVTRNPDVARIVATELLDVERS